MVDEGNRAMTAQDATKTTESNGATKAILIVAGAVLVLIGVLALVVNSGSGQNTGNQGTNQQAGGTGEDGSETDGNGAVAGPETAELVMTRARQAIDQGRPNAAVALLRDAIEEFGQDRALLVMYAEALAHTGERAQALAEFERALLIEDDASIRDFAASLAEELGDREKAELFWSIAQKLAPDNPKYPLYRGAVLQAMGRDQEAGVQFLAAVQLDPVLHQAWASLAGIAMNAGRLDPALQHIRKARDIAPNEVAYIQTEATVRRRKGQATQAAQLLQSIDQTVRTNNDALLHDLALCYGMLNEPDRAVAMYQDVTQRRANDPGPYFELATWAEQTGDLELALAASTRAYELGDERAIALVERLRDELGA